MSLLDVNTIGLRTLADDCRSRAIEVEATTLRQAVGLTGQATASAVDAVNADVDVAAHALAGRLLSNAAKLTQASTVFGVNEVQSAARPHDQLRHPLLQPGRRA